MEQLSQDSSAQHDNPLSRSRSLLLGVVAGVLAGLFGVGGGVILVPGLVWLARLPQHQAHATSLAAIIVTAPAALAPFAAEGDVAWPAAAALAAGAVLGAVGGAGVMSRIPAGTLRRIFGGFMLLVAARLVASASGTGAAEEAALAVTTGAIVGLAVTGLVTGLLSALMGVGGGIVMVPAMVIGFGFDQHLAQGTSLAVIVPTAVIGAWRHTRRGYTRWSIGLLVGAGGVLGGLAGAGLAQLLPARELQIAFAGLLVVSGVRLIRKRPAAAGVARE
ncbi:sulfite exporter TauE/SafE family protein [Euzebya tangerina]|uniref:sulfite exporter TauE/SafE family protein n=1 Tax=Euzebya tangerina TaxID=591198 RepID=UPI0013C339F9|nr:sulfite exporter TauE/SafE family protein [Euzebya tangerina]